MVNYPATRYRIQKIADGEGGSHEVLLDALPIWGAIVVHDEETGMVVDSMEDIQIGDIIETHEEIV